jgi:tetratricopeptide (TPR) repeat protein
MRSIFHSEVNDKYGLIEDYTEMVRINDSNENERKYDLAMRGKIYQEINEFDKAKLDYMEIMKIDSSYGKFCLADFYYKQKKYGLSYDIINELLRDNVYSANSFIDAFDKRFDGIDNITLFKKFLRNINNHIISNIV